MTTPQIPANSIELSDVRDEINPGSGSGVQSLGSNVVVRKLTGTFEKNRTQTSEILLGADLSNKTAFSEILTPSNSNTQSGIAPVTASMTVTANTDMFEPVINWSYVINPDSVNVTADDISITRNIVFDPVTNRPASKSANVTLRSSRGDKFANLTITGVMQFPNYDAQGLQEIGTHIVNTCTKNISLTVNAVNTAFQVTATPSFTLHATGVLAQTAVITVKASANDQLSGTSFKFTPTFVSGTGALTPITTANTITFTANAPQPGTQAAIYSLLTEFYINNVLIESNTSTVDIRAQFINRQITSLTTTATTNNQFSNSSSQYATIDVTAIHNAVAPTYTQGTITLTYEVSGDAITTQELSSNSSAKTERISLYYDAANGFGFKKSTVAVVATLRTPDGTIMDQKRVANLVLRAGTYGLDIKSPTSVTASGYAAQTAVTTGDASWRASQASFVWTPRQFNGSGPDLKITNSSLSSSFQITATTPSGKNRSQTVTNTCNYDITGVLSYDGITIRTVTINDILIKAESLPYTYSITTPATSNVQMEIDTGTTAAITVTGSASVGTITWTKADSQGTVGIATTSTTANVYVTSSSSGSSNVGVTSVSGELRDGSSRVIETIQTPDITLDATTTKLRIVGENVSKNTDERTSTATGIFESSALFGSHVLRFPPIKQSGSDLELIQDSTQRIRILATATQSSKSGTYRITGEVTYKGISRTTTRDVTVAVSALAPTLTATKVNYQYETYIPFGGVSFTSGVVGTGTSATYVLRKGVDIVVESDYPGTINVDYTIRRVVNYLPNVNGTPTVELTGPFYNQAANTDPAPAGYPASANKRRDRLEIVPFIGILLDYDITYELYDAAGTFIRDLRVTPSEDISIPQPGATTSLKFDNVTAKTFSFTNKSNNGFGYPEPHPLQVDYQQRADYTASYVTESSIPVPRFTFSTVKSNPSADVGLVFNAVNGQANVLVKSVYYDVSANFSGVLPTVTTSTGTVELIAQLTSTKDNQTYNISQPATQTRNFEVPMPTGRCFRLSTFSYGPRMYHTRDVFGNSSERIDYGRIPSSSTLNGPETKWVGFHSQTNTFAGHTGGYGQLYDPNASTSKPRPLYSLNGTRYYSSNAHRAFHNETPAVVIPDNYLMIMSFSQTGTPFVGQVTLIGSDNNAYLLGVNDIWASGSQNDRSRDNDSFNWYIFKWVPPAGVTINYIFISNVAGTSTPPPPVTTALTLTPVQPGNARVGDNVNISIGTVTGGIIQEDLYVDPGNISGGGGGDFDFGSINYN